MTMTITTGPARQIAVNALTRAHRAHGHDSPQAQRAALKVAQTSTFPSADEEDGVGTT